jgi:hypothetical protein
MGIFPLQSATLRLNCGIRMSGTTLWRMKILVVLIIFLPKLVVALGQSNVFAGTSSNSIYNFRFTGFQLLPFDVPGRIVALSSHSLNLLFVVYELESYDLCYSLIDHITMKTISEGMLPLSKKSILEWVGFSENGVIRL